VTVSTPQDHVDREAIDAFNEGQPFDIRRLRRVEPPVFEGAYRLYEAVKIVRQDGCDILLAVGKQAVWLAAAVSILTGVPLVAVGAGSEFLRTGGAGVVLTRWAYRWAARVIAISRYARELAGSTGIGLERIDVVHCGADAELYRPDLPTGALQEQLGLGGGRFILTVGQMSRRKAQDTVIRALPRLTRDFHVTYLVVGLPTRRKELERLAAELDMVDHVRFLGQVPQRQLPAIYNLADVFVLVSRPTTEEVEGYGIVVAEAALCGVPAVVSTNSGLVEAVVENETGLIVPPDDPHATAEAIARLLSDDSLRRRRGNAARHHALQNATWERQVRAYDDILRSIAVDGA
jgi:phosphatidylinositol alpha-1,6-mannosyltransferase